MRDFLDQFKSTEPETPGRPVKGRSRKPPVAAYAQVPLAWAARAAQATNSPAAVVWVEIIFLAWRAKGAPFPLSSGRLSVSRKLKCRVLRDLERAGLVAVHWRVRQAPLVTLLDPEPQHRKENSDDPLTNRPPL
jgi:hypothetical protein